MTYYEEDNPEIESAENEGMPTKEELVERMNEAAKERPIYLPSNRPEERHQEMMEMLGGIFIQMSRLYDAVMMTLDDEARKTAEHYHSKGKLLGDPPVLEEDAWS